MKIVTDIDRTSGVIDSYLDLEIHSQISDTAHLVIKTRDIEVRKALIALGWTPPKETHV